MIHKNKPELLAPAGDLERLRAALDYGADAVYLGRESFSMRAAASNFHSEAQLHEAVALAHQYGKPVYLTCNTLPRNEEIPTFPQFLREAQEAGADALILADLGLLALARKLAPDMEIHMSTQTGIVNYGTCRALYDMGVTRAVLARELSLEEIAEIRAKIPADMELEVFVHGAMCMSFSGRCLLSAYLTGRDANRGACAQPCRWNYHLMESTRPGQYFPVEETDEGTYIFNAKDLCMIGHLQELLAAGVDSLKIEGRNKSAYYVAIVTNAYRAALDAAKAGEPAPQWALDEVVQPPGVLHRLLLRQRERRPALPEQQLCPELRRGCRRRQLERRQTVPHPAQPFFCRRYAGDRRSRTAAGDGGGAGTAKRCRRNHRNRQPCHDAMLHCL